MPNDNVNAACAGTSLPVTEHRPKDDPVVLSLQCVLDRYKAGSLDVLFWQVIGHDAMPTKLCSTLSEARALCEEMGGNAFPVPSFG